MKLSSIMLAAIFFTALAQVTNASAPPLLQESVVAALAEELDGARAKRDVEAISAQHRMRASRGIAAASDYVVGELRKAGFIDAAVLRLPADGVRFYGTQKSRPAWDADFAELWELDGSTRRERLASYESMPLSLAQDSDSGEVRAGLVDVGSGTQPSDYEGKDVAGKLVLASSQPELVQQLAVGRFGAAGIVSYAQNQKTAWWGEDDTLVRWGHLDSFSMQRTFAFMISPRQAAALRSRLAAGEAIRLEARVVASRHPGEYTIATAAIAGSDPSLSGQEIAFSCHLDHPRPGANDNASGCAAILEAARALAALVAEGKLPRPKRTIRFYWPPEIEGTMALLVSHPELAERLRAVVHMDMVGGGPVTKAVFHVTRSPMSLPTFVNDVAEAFGAFVNAESELHAAGSDARFPLVADGGGKEALLAQMKAFDVGSDHVVYTDSSFAIPSIYLADWPDRYIHTTGDVPDNIDPTKLERAAFVGAASAWYLANLGTDDLPGLLGLLERQGLARASKTMAQRAAIADAAEKKGLEDLRRWYEAGVGDSVSRFVPVSAVDRERQASFLAGVDALVGATAAPARELSTRERAVYVRCPTPKGPLSVFGFDYLKDKLGAARFDALTLNAFEGERGGSAEYTFELLNFLDGKRNVTDVRSLLSAQFGAVPLEPLIEYLDALVEAGVAAEAGTGCGS